MKFLVYSEAPAATVCISIFLKEVFRNAAVSLVEFGSADLRNGIIHEPDVVGFCLPAIRGQRSGYTDQIGDWGQREMTRAVAAGRIMLTVCAGTYFINRKTIYNAPWNDTILIRTPATPMFNGIAQGPADEFADEYCLTLCPVIYLSQDGAWKEAKMAYGNGPMIFPDNPNDPGFEPLAHYASVPGVPIAAASQSIGLGQVLMLGILPYISPVIIYPTQDNEEVRRLVDAMIPHEPQRLDFSGVINTRIRKQVLAYQKHCAMDMS